MNTEVNNTELVKSSNEERIQKQREEQIRLTKERFVRVLMKQTEYNEEQARESLEKNNYNVPESIREYMGYKKEKKEYKPKTINQGIFKEIRDVMDDASMRYERKKEYNKRVQMLQQYYLQNNQTKMDNSSIDLDELD